MNWYYIDSEGKEIGPVSSSEFKKLAQEGVVQPSTSIRPENRTAFCPAEKVQGLFSEKVSPPVQKEASQKSVIDPENLVACTIEAVSDRDNSRVVTVKFSILAALLTNAESPDFDKVTKVFSAMLKRLNALHTTPFPNEYLESIAVCAARGMNFRPLKNPIARKALSVLPGISAIGPGGVDSAIIACKTYALGASFIKNSDPSRTAEQFLTEMEKLPSVADVKALIDMAHDFLPHQA